MLWLSCSLATTAAICPQKLFKESHASQSFVFAHVHLRYFVMQLSPNSCYWLILSFLRFLPDLSSDSRSLTYHHQNLYCLLVVSCFLIDCLLIRISCLFSISRFISNSNILYWTQLVNFQVLAIKEGSR